MINIRKKKWLRRKSFFGKILRLPFRLIPAETVLPVLTGPLRGCRWLKGSHNLSILFGRYERRQSQEFIAKAGSPAVFWDIGAHVGYYTLLFKNVNPSGKVYAFEPSPRNTALYNRHMKLNGVNGVRLFQNAVSDCEGTLMFDADRSSVAGRLSSSGQMLVEVVRISKLVSKMEVEIPHLIKMDIEGEEFKVLTDILKLLKEVRPVLFLSTHGAEIHGKCVSLLSDLKYRLSPLDSSSLENCREILAE